jgi:transcriptional regulator with XRE-family HTH domain
VNYEFTQRQQEGGEAMPDRTIIGERLKRLRGSRTLADVATALGVTEMAVSLWERGERMPSDDMKVKIANYYRRSVTTLFFKD